MIPYSRQIWIVQYLTSQLHLKQLLALSIKNKRLTGPLSKQTVAVAAYMRTSSRYNRICTSLTSPINQSINKCANLYKSLNIFCVMWYNVFNAIRWTDPCSCFTTDRWADTIGRDDVCYQLFSFDVHIRPPRRVFVAAASDDFGRNSWLLDDDNGWCSWCTWLIIGWCGSLNDLSIRRAICTRRALVTGSAAA